MVAHMLLNWILSNEKKQLQREIWRRGRKKPPCDSLSLLRVDLLATALRNARKHLLISKSALLPLSFTVPVLNSNTWVCPFLLVL